MGIMDMVNKAKANMIEGNDGDFLLKDQQGEILIHAFTFFESDKGKWAAIKGEIVKSQGKTSTAVVQPAGTKVKVIYKCHGDYPSIGYEGVVRAIKAIYDPSDDNEFKESMVACFGSDESGFTKKASDADKKHPLFAARGVIVAFSTKNAKNSEKRVALGKEPIVETAFSHIPQEVDAITARAAKLPEVT
jgi:hypothetical protein